MIEKEVIKLLNELDLLGTDLSDLQKHESYLANIRILRSLLYSLDANALPFATIFDQKERIKKHNDFYMVEAEIAETRNLLQRSIANYGELLQNINEQYLYFRAIDKHKIWDIAEVENKEIIVIGSGAFPDSVLHLGFNKNCKKIIGIDNNKVLLDAGKDLVTKLLKTKPIEFVYANGSEYNFCNADLVFIAGFVNNKAQIVKQVLDTKTKFVKILVDNTIEITNLLFEPLNLEYLSNYKLSIKAHEIQTLYGLQQILEINTPE